MKKQLEGLIVAIMISCLASKLLPLYINSLQEYEAYLYECIDESVNTFELCHEILGD